jgi:putative tricarboxylic transport membrane protein
MLDILASMGVVFYPMNFLILSIGTFFGLLCGALPGISGTMAVVLLIPLTYALKADMAFMLMVATYVSAVFSGSISAILFRVPGAPEAVATTLDGYKMTEKGLAAEALGWSISASAFGGVVGTLVLITVSPQMARVALAFGSPEYFALAIAGISVIAVMNRGRELKGYICAGFGMFLASVGMDPMVGSNRFTFGNMGLMSGISLVAVVTGMFAVAEILRKIQIEAALDEQDISASRRVKSKLPSWRDWADKRLLFLRSSILGTFIGILPGVGATTAAVLAYSEGMRWSKTPEKWGTGIPEGVVAPESSNNAAANGALVPLLALGIPGSATTAIMLGAFILHGIRPGPGMFTENASLVYAIFGASMLSNFMVLFYARPFIRLFANIIRIPFTLLGPAILMLCVVGCYAVRNSMLDVWVMLGTGILGYYLEKYRFPIVSILLGLVLGNMAEVEFRTSLLAVRGDAMVFFYRPISCVLLITAILAFIVPQVLQLRAYLRSGGAVKTDCP